MSSTKVYSPPKGGRGVKLKPNQFLLPSSALITEIPLLFQEELIKANLADRKTQTRRERNLDFINLHPDEWELCWVGDTVANKRFPKVFGAAFQHRTFRDKVGFIKSPYGKPGDLLWFRESFYKPIAEGLEGKFFYKADLEKQGWKFKWTPSIHMPKAAARIWAMVESIRVERVQDISEEDAKAEGVKPSLISTNHAVGFSYKLSFAALWETINSEDSWNSNPWVWVVAYRILSKTGRPSLKVIEQNYLDVIASRHCEDEERGRSNLPNGKIAASPQKAPRNDERKEVAHG